MSTLDLILRVPPLFIMDSILNTAPDDSSSKLTMGAVSSAVFNETHNLTLPADGNGNILSLSESFVVLMTQSMGWILLSFSGMVTLHW